MEEKQVQKPHKLVVNNRKTSMVTGVLDVLSFDLNEILLETEQGMLMVKGKDLHVNRLSVEKVKHSSEWPMNYFYLQFAGAAYGCNHICR